MILKNYASFLLLSFYLLFFLLSLPTWIAAQTTTAENNRERPAATNQPAQEQAKAHLPEAAVARISGLVRKMNDRFEVVITRLNNIANRLESRSQKVAAEEANAIAADTYVTSAKEKLIEATALSAETDRILQELFDSSAPRENWSTLRAHLAKIKSLIRGAHNDLLRALSNLKTERSSRAATSTNPTSSNDTRDATLHDDNDPN